MIVKAMDIIGLPVYLLETGEKIEDVDDVIYDPEENKIEALLVDKGGWFSDAKVVLLEDIRGIGKDAVIIDSESVLKKASDVKENISLITKGNTELTGSRIITEDGKELGKIEDIYFDTRSGKVEEFEVSQGTFGNLGSGKKRIRFTDIVTIGQDATIVKGITEEEFEAQSMEHGIKGAFYRGRSKIGEDAERIRERAPGFIEQIAEDVKNVGRRTQDEIYGLSEQVKEDIVKARTNPKNKDLLDRIAENIRNVGKRAQEEIYRLSDQMKSNFEEVKTHPRTRSTIEDIRMGASRAQEMTRSKIKEYRDENLERRKRDAIGQHLTKVILTPGDKVLAKEGDLVTHKLLSQAKQYGVLDQVLKNIEKCSGNLQRGG